MTYKLSQNPVSPGQWHTAPMLCCQPSSRGEVQTLSIGNAPSRDFCELLSEQIPADWHESLRRLVLAEREIVVQRQKLVKQYRAQFKPIAEQFTSTFAEQYPELLL